MTTEQHLQSTPKDEVEWLKKRVNDLEYQLQAFRQLNTIRTSLIDTQDTLVINLSTTTSGLYGHINELNAQIAAQKLEIEKLKANSAQLQQQLQNKSDSLAKEGLHTSSSDNGFSTVRASPSASSSSSPQTVTVICKKILLDGVVAELGFHFKCTFTPYVAEPPNEVDGLQLPADAKVIVCLVVTTPRSVDATKLNQYLGVLTEKGMHAFVLFLVYGTDVPERKLDYPFGNLLYSKNLIDPSATVKFTYTKECHAALDPFINQPKTSVWSAFNTL